MRIFGTTLLLMFAFSGFAQAQQTRASVAPGYYLKVDSCTACGAYGNQIVRLLKQNGINAFNGYAQCTGSCFSTGQYAMANRVVRMARQGNEVSVIVGPFKTLGAARDVLGQLKSILRPVFRDAWAQGWENSQLVHDRGNAYTIEPMTIWVLRKN